MLKNKKMKFLTGILILFLIAIYACTSSSEMNATWKSPTYKGKKFNKIVVLAIHKDLVIRSTVEKEVVKQLSSYKRNAISGSNIIDLAKLEKGDDDKLSEKSKEYLRGIFKESSIDAALVIALKDVKESEHYVPGSTYYTPYYSPYAGYGSFYGYYWSSYNMYSTPGYMEKTTQVFLVSNLYDITTEELVWSGQSETVNPTSISDFSKSYSYLLVTELVNKKIVK